MYLYFQSWLEEKRAILLYYCYYYQVQARVMWDVVKKYYVEVLWRSTISWKNAFEWNVVVCVRWKQKFRLKINMWISNSKSAAFGFIAGRNIVYVATCLWRESDVYCEDVFKIGRLGSTDLQSWEDYDDCNEDHQCNVNLKRNIFVKFYWRWQKCTVSEGVYFERGCM